MARRHWLLKTEPSEYAWADLARDGRAQWTGIRNFQARNHLREMKKGDLALLFHTGSEKAVVGVAEVVAGPGPDPTAPGEDWSSVELAPVRALQAVPLSTLKATAALSALPMLKQGRLSVSPVTPGQYRAVLALGGPARKSRAR